MCAWPLHKTQTQNTQHKTPFLRPPPPLETKSASSRRLFRGVCGWLLVASHVLWALERAPVLIAESEELSKVHVVVSVVHLVVGGKS